MRDCQDLHLLYWFFFVFVSLCLAASPCRLLCRIVPPSSCVFKWPSFSLLGYIFQGSSVSDVLCSWVPPSVLQVLIISVFGSPLLLKPIASIGFTCPSCWASCVFSSVHSSHSLHHSWCFWYFTLLSSISSLFAHITDEVIFTSHNYHFYQHFLTYAPPPTYTRLRVKARYPDKWEFCSFPIILYTWVSMWCEDHCTRWMIYICLLSEIKRFREGVRRHLSGEIISFQRSLLCSALFCQTSIALWHESGAFILMCAQCSFVVILRSHNRKNLWFVMENRRTGQTGIFFGNGAIHEHYEYDLPPMTF